MSLNKLIDVLAILKDFGGFVHADNDCLTIHLDKDITDSAAKAVQFYGFIIEDSQTLWCPNL